MRFLHARPDHECDRAPPGRAGGRRPRTRARGDERQSVPLWRLPRHRRGGARSQRETHRHRPEGRSMKIFDYIRPATPAEAVAAALAPGSAYLGGGTNLLDLMKVGAARPDRVVDITR